MMSVLAQCWVEPRQGLSRPPARVEEQQPADPERNSSKEGVEHEHTPAARAHGEGETRDLVTDPDQADEPAGLGKRVIDHHRTSRIDRRWLVIHSDALEV